MNMEHHNQVLVSNIFYVHPEPWGNDPIWRTYFLKGAEKTTNQISHVRHWAYLAGIFSSFRPTPPPGLPWMLGGSADLASSCLTTLEKSEVAVVEPRYTRWKSEGGGVTRYTYVYLCIPGRVNSWPFCENVTFSGIYVNLRGLLAKNAWK